MAPNPAATATKISQVLRNSFDQILDGVHTGRFDWPQLYKTEKTRFGTLVEINLRRAFPQFGDGLLMDYLIDGVEVDCKYSQKLFAWMIPGEALGHVCLVAWAEDKSARWSMGLVRITKERLRESVNQDKKSQLNDAGKAAIRWLYEDEGLPPNVYLQLAPEKVKDILDPGKSGQKRVVRLFTHAVGMKVGRGAVATAAQQDDFLKRVRYNGGARDLLRPDGIVYLRPRTSGSGGEARAPRAEQGGVRVSQASAGGLELAATQGHN